ncbi:hypothetical protein JDV09_23690 [Mycobacterium sp. Y57]|uniref:hypothetical protein n=1 Tax=Mycolicibacterium xanthum TaxID=2796469 RepID=UPI001C863DE5|nr:hypothetical protein [Mycolicibacterium xanthum]MBX7435077.1 hypothetical protein [Mycolicibacterium xanthum]
MTQTQNADIQQTAKTVQAAGAWLAVASFLIVLTLVFHGPLADDLGGQMTRIAEAANTWSVVHWIAALSLSLYAVAGLLVLTSRSRLV